MFEPAEKPRVFGVPLGADFAKEIVARCLSAHQNEPPDALPRVQIIVNTERMRRRLIDEFSKHGPRLLPRITPITAVDRLVPGADLPTTQSKLARKLDLARLIRPLLDAPDAPAPKSALFALADSLAALMDELHGENVDPKALLSLKVEDASRYWERSLAFLSVVQQYLDETGTSHAVSDAKLRAATEALVSNWTRAASDTPVLLVGSTGSRGTTFELMKAVANLPQGAVVLPGFDTDLPSSVWSRLADPSSRQEDHPQYRFAVLAEALGLNPSTEVAPWGGTAPDPDRNALISLSLRPAPITSQWRVEGPRLGDLAQHTKNLALIEAPQPREEALSIAIALREAAHKGETAALITPDRTLSRRVAAALGRWSIIPDDSAGRPLSLTPPGRFLRHVGDLLNSEVASEKVIALLKHPLTQSHDDAVRGNHLLATRELELFLRRKSVTALTSAVLDAFTGPKEKPSLADWASWLKTLLSELERPPSAQLGPIVQRHLTISESIAGGDAEVCELWKKEAGHDTKAAMETLAADDIASTHLILSEYLSLMESTLSSGNTRNTELSHPQIMIWGTLEARVMGVDLAILGGLNEGVWPGRPDPDPWLSRQMRREAGLLSPEREIGLSAHDYQQAAAAPRVILSRARRDDDAETVPSRWLNRLTNLMTGLSGEDVGSPLAKMRERGTRYLDLAGQLDLPSGDPSPESRNAPAPPVAARTKSYTVTDIEKLIRDPFAIYARYSLKLQPLNPLKAEPSAAMRGTVFHAIVERLLNEPLGDAATDVTRFLEIADKVLHTTVPWPSVRRQWFGHLSAIAQDFIEQEISRQKSSRPLGQEIKGLVTLPSSPFELRGKADRIDHRADGALIIYDYKTGTPPSEREMRYFKRQLLVEAVMAERGAFADIPAERVARVDHIGMNRALKMTGVPMDFHDVTKSLTIDYRTETVERELLQLLEHFNKKSMGYMPRRAMERVRFSGDYDHLSRFGEWDDSDAVVKVDLS